MHEHPFTRARTHAHTMVAIVITLLRVRLNAKCFAAFLIYLIFSPRSLTELLTTINPLSLIT